MVRFCFLQELRNPIHVTKCHAWVMHAYSPCCEETTCKTRHDSASSKTGKRIFCFRAGHERYQRGVLMKAHGRTIGKLACRRSFPDTTHGTAVGVVLGVNVSIIYATHGVFGICTCDGLGSAEGASEAWTSGQDSQDCSDRICSFNRSSRRRGWMTTVTIVRIKLQKSIHATKFTFESTIEILIPGKVGRA